jgi:hypothetical protein
VVVALSIRVREPIGIVRFVNEFPNDQLISLKSWPELLTEYHWQFQMARSLANDVFLPGLTDEICHWMPHFSASTVTLQSDGRWEAAWSEPPPGEPWHATVAWMTWHLQWWLTSALAEVQQQEVPERTLVQWPGSADGVRNELQRLVNEWTTVLKNADGQDPNRPTLFPWSQPRPLHKLVGWANFELTKNVSEIGIIFNLARHQPSIK